jgi:hypothetical protein
MSVTWPVGLAFVGQFRPLRLPVVLAPADDFQLPAEAAHFVAYCLAFVASGRAGLCRTWCMTDDHINMTNHHIRSTLRRRTLLDGLFMPVLGALTAGCGGSDVWGYEASILRASLDAQLKNPAVHSAIGRMEIGNEVVFAGAAGTISATNKTPVRADTPFKSASVGKLFTAVTVLRLIEQGRLLLDTPIGHLLPPALLEPLHVLGGVSRGPQLTIRQLLGHTTGLANIDDDPAFNGAIAENPTKVWQPAELLQFSINACGSGRGSGSAWHGRDVRGNQRGTWTTPTCAQLHRRVGCQFGVLQL